MSGGSESRREAIIIIDSNDEIIGWDKYAEKLHGWRDVEIIGERIFKIIPTEYRASFMSILENSRYCEKVEETEGLRVTKSGEVIYVNATIRPITDSEGNLSSIAIYETDISDQVNAKIKIFETEEQYKRLVECLSDGIILIDTDYKVVLTNPALSDVLNLDENSIGKRFIDIIGREHFKVIQQNIEKLEENNRVDFELEFTSSEETKFLSIAFTPIKSMKGATKAYLGVFRNITEVKKLEEELIKAAKLESIEILAGGIAHDFNNILTIILGNLSLIKAIGSVKGKVLERIEKAERAALRAKDLTQQLLAFTKGGSPIKRKTSIVNVIEESVTFVSSGSNVKIEVDIQEDIWGVEIDEGQINQVLNNLFINAQQAMPEGGKIWVKAENFEIDTEESGLALPPGKYIRIMVKDEGHGIPSDILPRIFEPYFTTKKNGHGLGLSTAYTIVRRHHGAITVESEPGRGTTFCVYLPSLGEYVEPEVKHPDAYYRGHGRILVMDDEDGIREMAGAILKKLGYKVDFACDGMEAIKKYKKSKKRRKKYDAVILDLTVPGGMGGRETIAKLLEIDPEVVAIVSSGYSNDPIMANYRQYGFAGTVRKPYRLGELGKVLKEVLTKNKE